MIEFAQTLRHYCRNPRCRSKLPSPAFDPRKAFCTRGCHSSFYLKRCLVCENDKPVGSRSDRKLCRRPKCRTQYAGNRLYFEPYSEKPVAGIIRNTLSSKEADSIGVKGVSKSDRAWRIVAGPQLTPSQLHCAAAPDGPDCQGKGGEYDRIEARNRAVLRAHFDKLKADEQAEIKAGGEFTEPEWREVISPDGVRCFVTRFSDVLIAPEIDAARVKALIKQIPDDLSIPDFLKREPAAASESPEGLAA